MNSSESNLPASSESDDGPSFCAIPWKHLHLADTGTVRICCATPEIHDDNGKPFNIYTHSIDEIWNSKHLRRVRREMVMGEPVKECAHFCGRVEKHGGISRRLSENTSWRNGRITLEGVTIENLKEEAKKNDYVVNHKPFDLDFEVSNLCNLACRMCNPDRSSKIENDPVHNKWSNKLNHISKWAHDTAVIGPHPFMNIVYEGFYQSNFELDSASKNNWTDGKGKIIIKNVGQKIVSLLIRFSPTMPDDHTVKIYINDVMYYNGCPINDGLSQLCEIENPALIDDLTVSIESAVFTTNEIDKPVGVGIEHMEIKRQKEPGQVNDLISSRLATKKHWHKDNEFVYKELLANPKQLRHIQFIGGEPLINKEVLNTFNYLIENGSPKDLIISFTTNATIYNENIFDKAKDFKKMVVAISLDGVGDVLEYIRYPAKWLNVRDNLLRISKTENIYTMASITYQAYNALDFVDLLHFCDQQDIHFSISKVQHPDYLSFAVLPPKARQIAAQRLREYVENECRDRYKKQIESFISQLEAMGDEWDTELVRKFMLFTNDMDNSRNQSFSKTNKELLKYIKEMGYIWTKETLHFEKATLPPISMQKSINQTEIQIN